MVKEIEMMIKSYFTKNVLDEMKYFLSKEDEYTVRFGKSDYGLHRGIYFNGILSELGVKTQRGILCKNNTQKNKANYIYYYDQSENVRFIRNLDNELESLTMIKREKDVDFSITVPLTSGFDTITIAETVYKNSQIQIYKELIICLEEFYDEFDEKLWWNLESILNSKLDNNYSYEALVEQALELTIEKYQYKENCLIAATRLFFDYYVGCKRRDAEEKHFTFQYEGQYLQDEVETTIKRGKLHKMEKYHYTLTSMQKKMIDCINRKENMFKWLEV